MCQNFSLSGELWEAAPSYYTGGERERERCDEQHGGWKKGNMMEGAIMSVRDETDGSVSEGGGDKRRSATCWQLQRDSAVTGCQWEKCASILLMLSPRWEQRSVTAASTAGDVGWCWKCHICFNISFYSLLSWETRVRCQGSTMRRVLDESVETWPKWSIF